MFHNYSDRELLKYDNDHLLERHDLHYQQGESDKVYILTLQQGVIRGEKIYQAIGHYGRRGAHLNINILGNYKQLHNAHDAMHRQMRNKEKKGYQHVGMWSAEGKSLLRKEVIEMLENTFPKGAKVLSPSGKEGVILHIDEYGGLHVQVASTTHELKMGEYGMLKVHND